MHCFGEELNNSPSFRRKKAHAYSVTVFLSVFMVRAPGANQ